MDFDVADQRRPYEECCCLAVVSGAQECRRQVDGRGTATRLCNSVRDTLLRDFDRIRNHLADDNGTP